MDKIKKALLTIFRNKKHCVDGKKLAEIISSHRQEL